MKKKYIKQYSFAIYNHSYYGEQIIQVLKIEKEYYNCVTILGSRTWFSCYRRELSFIKPKHEKQIKCYYNSLKTELENINRGVELLK